MNFRTITCWVVHNPKSRSIVNGFRTKKELNQHYSAGPPIGCVVVRMRGHYLPPRPMRRIPDFLDSAHSAHRRKPRVKTRVSR